MNNLHPLLRSKTLSLQSALLTVLFSAIVAPYVAILSFLVW